MPVLKTIGNVGKTKVFRCLIIFIFIPGILWANQEIKDLEKKLAQSTSREKIDVLNQLAAAYYNLSAQKTLEYGTAALNLSRKFNDKKGEGIALRNIGVGRGKSGDFEKSLDYIQQSLKLLETQGDEREIANSLNSLGSIYLTTNNYIKALEYYRQSLKIRESLDIKKDIADSYGNIGSLYRKLGNYHKALEYQLMALEIREDTGDKPGIAAVYNDISTIYVKINDYPRALEYSLESLKIKEEIGNKAGIASSLENIGLIHEYSGDLPKALEYQLISLDIKKEIGDKTGICSSLNSIGDIYLKTGDNNKALEYYRQSLQHGEEIGALGDISDSLVNMGVACRQLHRVDDAFSFLERGLKIAREIDGKETIKTGYFNLSELYAAGKNFEESLEYFKRYSQLKDELFNEKINRQMTQMQTRYETLKKEKEIEILKKNSRIQELMLTRQTRMRNISIFISLLLIVIFIQFFNRYRYLFTFWKKKHYIAHFRLLDKISSGGMGDVYRAHNIRDRSITCALKILREEYAKDDDYRRRFKNEAALIDQLDHPNVVKVLERGECENQLYIAMELLEGQTLFAMLDKEGKIRLETALSIMVQIADALAAIHYRGIIHRDLKPENIMIVSTRQNPFHVKVLDFGLARPRNLSRLTRTGTVMGTLFYISPEQLSKSKVSPASDVYSLGVIYYQVLTGEKPFSGDSTLHIARQILKKPPPDMKKRCPGLPPGLNETVKKMLSKDPLQRPSAAEVLAALKEIENHIKKGTAP